MHTDQVQLLLDLAQTHSFNQTAERYYTTQQSVSYNIKQLEKELDVKIFNRSKSGVEFTSEGEYVLECAVKMDEAYKSLLKTLHGEQNGKPYSQLAFFSSSVLFTKKMPRIIKEFKKVCPENHLLIREIPPDNIVQALMEGDCDMAVCSANEGYLQQCITIHGGGMVEMKRITEDFPVAVVAVDSELVKKDILKTEDLNNSVKTIFGLQPIDYFGKNVAPYILYADNNLEIHQQMVAEGNAICFTARKIYEHLFSKDKFIALDFDYPVLPIYHVILQKKSAQHINGNVLEQIIIEQFAE